MNPSDSDIFHGAKSNNFNGLEADGEVPSRLEALGRAAAKLGMAPEELDVFFRNGFHEDNVPADLGGRRSMLAYLRKHETPPPRWIQISGLWPELERGEWGPERRVKVRAVQQEAVRLIVRALREHENDPDKGERSIFWDPVIEVCRELEISQSKLSELCKELTGNSLKQTIDCVRAKGLREKLKAGLRKELGAYFGTEMGVSRKGAEAQRTAKNGEEKWEVWKVLKATRKWPEFSQNGWANGLGFCSYRRMYRACQVIFGKTPHQMEMELIEEMLKERDEGEKVEVRTEFTELECVGDQKVSSGEQPEKEPRT